MKMNQFATVGCGVPPLLPTPPCRPRYSLKAVVRLALLLVTTAANANVITNTVGFQSCPIDDVSFTYSIMAPPPPPGAVGYMVSIGVRAPGNYHAEWFYSVDGNRCLLANATIDLVSSTGISWFPANYGQELTTSALYEGEFHSFNEPLSVSPTPFYIGVTLGYESGRVFGWAKVLNDGTGITLLESAVSYGPEDYRPASPGIYIGTLSEVPEPATASLLVLGTIWILALRRTQS